MLSLVAGNRTQAQSDIVRIEYFIDSDPGFGNATPLSFAPDSAITNIQAAIDPSGLTAGIHAFIVRAMDANGNWSLSNRWLFMKPFNDVGSAAPPNISYAEWFIDTDPGFNNANSIPVTPGIELSNLLVNIDPTNLSSGIHSFIVRARDANGNWSMNNRWLLLKPYDNTIVPLPNIAYAEWFIDADPGLGNANNITFTPGLDLNALTINIDPAGFTSGLHSVVVRAKDAYGNWSLNNRWLFIKPYADTATNLSNIVRLEYYIDVDPGYGNGATINIIPATDINNLAISINVDTFPLGQHKLHIRALDANGSWSLLNSANFKIDPPTAVFVTVGTLPDSICAGSNLLIPFTVNALFGSANTFTAQLSDKNGSFVNAVTIGSLQFNNSDTVEAVIPSNTQKGANYRIRIIATSPIDTSYSTHSIIINRSPEQGFSISGKNNACPGVETYSSSNIEPGASYTWQLSGGGTIDTAGLVATITWTTPGTYTLQLQSYNVCGNGPVSTLQVTVSALTPVAAPVITNTGRWLYASPAPAGTFYQWYRNDTAINGATASSYHAINRGSYSAKYTSFCGAGPASNIISFATDLLSQVINFPGIPDKVYGDPPFVLQATASSSLPVVYRVVSGPVTLSGDTVIITGAGNANIEARQPGNDTFDIAAPVYRQFTIQRAVQAITFDSIPDKTFGDNAFTVTATSSAGLPVYFTVQYGNATVSGNSIHLSGAGRVIVRAIQSGNQHYHPASADRTFCVNPVQPGAVTGFTQVCKSVQAYTLSPVPGFVYNWSLSGGGMLSAPTGNSILVTWTNNGNYQITVNASAECGLLSPSRIVEIVVSDTLVPAAPSNLYPPNGAVINDLPFALSWKPSLNAERYDLYIWPATAAEPSSPAVSNLTQIGYAVTESVLPGFAPGKVYKWKVVAKNSCAQTASAIQTFSIVDIPNLIVANIEAPASAFSGTEIEITAEIKNTGRAATGNKSWIDGVYLSADTILNKSIDEFLGGKAYVSALNIGQSYLNTIRIKLAENITGPYYLLVMTDAYSNVGEESENDNISYKAFPITLTPPPDLQVESLVTVADAFSGQQVNVEWTVKNKGNAATKNQSWYDAVYITPDPVFDVNAAIKLGSKVFLNGPLKKDSAYTANMLVTIPARTFGTQYIFVFTDAEKQVYEFTFENNNTARSDSINVFLTPPPDFVVTGIQQPAQAVRDELIAVSWTVHNQGATAPSPYDGYWADAIYISKDSVFNKSNALLLANRSPNIPPLMQPDVSYNNSTEVAIPAGMEGTAYLYVVTDHTNVVFEYLQENNNIAKSSILILSPDLVITDVKSPAGSSGQPLDIEWTIKNNGPGKLIQSYRNDKIWLSADSNYASVNKIFIGYATYNNALEAGASASLQRSFNIPDSLSGDYYLFIETDDQNLIFENGNEHNNYRYQPLHIALSPAPDLRVQHINIDTDTIESEKPFAIHFKVINEGNKEIIGKTWKDVVFLSKDSVFNSNAFVIKQYPRTQNLPVQGVYEVNDSLTISMNLLRQLRINNMSAYLYVFTDHGQLIYENDGEADNIIRSDSIFAMHAEHTDFIVTNATMPDSVFTGSQQQVQWTVKNEGGKTGYYYDYWYDGIFFSRDTVFNSTDTFVTDKVLYGPLNKGESYQSSLNFQVPNGLTGKYYLLLVADHKNFHRDKNFSNNYKIFKDSLGIATPIEVTLTQPCDLIVDQFQSPSLGTAGQPLLIKWQVKNLGPGGTIKRAWTERVYLSLDDKADPTDRLIFSYLRNDSLAAGASYNDSAQVFLPINAAGNYYILFYTDNNSSIYEHNAEHNNVAASTLFVIQAPPSDLVVSGIIAPAQAITGDTVSISWKVKNIGQNPASGQFSEGVYLSADSLWDNADVLAKDVVSTINLPPLGEALHTVQVKISGVTPGNYYTIIRTDLRDNIAEQDENNNVQASAGKMNISIRELLLDVLTSNTLRNNQELLYRLEIPASLEGETIRISLKGDSLAGVNELYARFGQVPSRSLHDFIFNNPFSGNQEIIIPSANAGTYYIMVYGATPLNQQQGITLLARKISFGIHTIMSREGGNTGMVTVKITGARFEENMQLSLLDATLGIITAASIKYINSVSVFATFNLGGARLGVYDVKLVKTNNQEAVLPDGFTVVRGSGGGLTGGGATGGGFYCNIRNIGVEQLLGISIEHPDATRTRRVFPMVINFGNSGNVDIPIPSRILVSLLGSPVAFTPEEIELGMTELFIEFKELNGPDNVLRPGATGSIVVYTRAVTISNGLRFRLIE